MIEEESRAGTRPYDIPCIIFVPSRQGYTNDQLSFLLTPGETHSQSRCHPMSSIQPFDPPIYRTLLLSAAYDESLAEILNALKIW